MRGDAPLKLEPEKNESATSDGLAQSNPLVLASPAFAPTISQPAPVTQPAPPAILTAMPSASGLVAAFRRRWFLTLTVSVSCAMVATVFAWFLPTTCKVRTSLHVAAQRPYILSDVLDRSDFALYQKSQLTLVRSRHVLKDALQNPSVASLKVVTNQPDPLVWLEKLIQVDFQNGPEILSISIAGEQTESPETWITLVDAVRDSYLKEIVNKEKKHHKARLERIQKMYADYDERLQAESLTLRKQADALGSKQPEAIQMKQQFMYNQLASLQNELISLQSQKRRLQLDVEASQVKQHLQKEGALPPEEVEDRLNQHPDVVKLSATLRARQATLQTLKDGLRNPESDPTFLAGATSVANLQDSLSAQRKTLRSEIIEQLREETLAQLTVSLAAHTAQLATLEKLAPILDEQISKQLRDIEAVGKSTVNMEWLNDAAKNTAEVHKRIGALKDSLQVEMEAPERISLLDPGYLVSSPTRKDRLKTAVLAGCAFFGLGFMLVPLLEFRARRVNAISDVVQGLGFSLVGTLPRLPASVLSSKAVFALDSQWARTLADSADATRTMLVHEAKRHGLRVIMVTSALKGEGKTLLASNLAISMARGGFRTLLIDADMRDPAVHGKFDLPVAPGLGEFLRRELGFRNVLHKQVSPCLSVVTAGRWGEDTTTILAQRNLRTLFKKLTRRFDFILIDTPPILPVPDTMLIAQNVDAALFAVLRDISRLTTVYTAYERLAMLDIPIMGAVVAGMPFENYGNYYAKSSAEIA